MSQEDPHDRLAWARRAAGFSTATEAARAYGWNENTYRSHENGERGLKPSIVKKYAKSFHVSPDYILFGSKTDRPSNRIPILGKINGNFVAEFYNKEEPYGIGTAFAQMPFDLPSDFFAFELVYNSAPMGLRSGTLVLCWTEEYGAQAVTGTMAVIEKPDGETVLTQAVKSDHQDLVRVVSTDFSGVEEFRPVRAFIVFLLVPPGRWDRHDDAP